MSNKHIFFIHGVGVQSDEKLQRKISDLAENYSIKHNGDMVNETTVQLGRDKYKFHYINWYKMCDYSRKNIKYNFKNILRIFNFLPLVLYVLAKDRGDENKEEPFKGKGIVAKLFMNDPVSTISNARSINRIGILFLAIFAVLWIIFNFGILPVVIFLGLITVCISASMLVFPRYNYISHIYSILDDINIGNCSIIRNICSSIEKDTEDGDEIILIGHSLGGYVSHHISLNFNKYINKRVLVRLITVQSGLRPVIILQNIYSTYSWLWVCFFIFICDLLAIFLVASYIKVIYEYCFNTLYNIFTALSNVTGLDNLDVLNTTLLAGAVITLCMLVLLALVHYFLNFRLPRISFGNTIEGPSFGGLWIDIFSPRDVVSRFIHPDIVYHAPYFEIPLTPEYSILGNHVNYFKNPSESLDLICTSIINTDRLTCENNIQQVRNNWNSDSRPRMLRISLYYTRIMYIYLIIAELFVFLQVSRDLKYLIGPIIIILLFVILIILLYYFKIDNVADSQYQDYAVLYIRTVGGSAVYSAESASAYMFGSTVFLDGASWIYLLLVFLSSILTLSCILFRSPRYRINIVGISLIISMLAFTNENSNRDIVLNILPFIISFFAMFFIILPAGQEKQHMIGLVSDNVINKLIASEVNVIDLNYFIELILEEGSRQFTKKDVQILYINKIVNYGNKKNFTGNLIIDKKENKVYL